MRLLEARAGQEALRLKRSLRDAEEQRLRGRGTRLLGLARSLAFGLGERVRFLDLGGVDERPDRQGGSAGVLDAALAHQRVVDLVEDELVDDVVRQELRIARVRDADLREHLAEDDLDVLVVDRHALRAVDVLHLAEHVVVQRVLALDAQDVGRNERSLGQRVACLDAVAGVDEQLPALRHVVVVLESGVADDDEIVILPLALLRAELDEAVDLGHDGRILRLARLEDLGDARQTARDVLRAGDLARLAREQRARRDLLALLHFDAGLAGQVVEVEDLAVRPRR